MDLNPPDSGYNKVNNTKFLNIIISSTYIANKIVSTVKYVCVH